MEARRAYYKKVIFLSVFFGGIFYLLFLVRAILPSFILALVIAYILNPLVDHLHKRGVSRALGIATVYASLGIVITAVGIYIIPILINELNKFAENLPVYVGKIEELVRNFYAYFTQVPMPESVRTVIFENIQNIEATLLGWVRILITSLLGMFSHLIDLVIAPILAIYILKDAEMLKERTVSLIPRPYRHEVVNVLKEVDQVLSSLIRCQLLVCSLVAVLVSIGLYFLDIDFAIVIGILAGMFDIIPYIGPIIGAIPALFLALIRSPVLFFEVAVLFFVIQQIEGNFIAPKIIGDGVGLHPLLIIFALLVGGELFGILGILFAVPVTAVLKVIFKHAYAKLLYAGD